MISRAFAKVLCEGLQDACFARRLLSRMGVSKHEIHVESNPRGAGSGEQFVREHYPEELTAQRERQARRRAILVVITDADTRTVAVTRQQLAEQLALRDLPARSDVDAVAVLIPRRNIETWLHALEGTTVDETTAYPKRRGRESDCQTAVDRLLALLPGDTTKAQPPSLAEALRELKPLIALLRT